MEQNKDNIRAWVGALRSGEYRQAQGALRKGDCFCALGVACDLSGLGRWTAAGYRTEHDLTSCRLPVEVQAWLGVPDGDPDLKVDDEHTVNVSALNDNANYTFRHIADALERTYLEPPL